MAQALKSTDVVAMLLGRSLVHPLFDYLLIGGGISLAVSAAVVWRGGPAIFTATAVPYLILLASSAHFGASTVRLYSKRGTFQALPFLTMAFPAVCFAVTTLCFYWPKELGLHLHSLFLTWSPYHNAAQAYGLAVIYAYRSGCLLTATDKKLLFWISMAPFLKMFFGTPQVDTGTSIGMAWLLDDSLFSYYRPLQAYLEWPLFILAFIAPVLLYFKVWRSASGPMPLISIMVLYTTSVWYFVLGPLHAFVWATIFHGIQYLSIVIIFHVRDQMDAADNHHGIVYHVIWFYGLCLLLGYGLFNCVPMAYQFVGFSVTESLIFVAATINIHHFVVDAYIWRLKKSDSNRKVVDSG